jgi:transcriptional regulator with XRE-family HTH domain
MRIKSEMTEKTLKEIEKITGTALTLGKLLWAIRQADDVSQIDFASKLGITRQHLCDIEHERKGVSPKLAAQYASLLGYSEIQFIRLSLQDLMKRENLNVEIEVTSRTKIRTFQKIRIQRMAA